MVLPAGRLASGKQERRRERFMEMTTYSSVLGGRVLEGGREGPEELCWEILHVGGNITTGDFIFLYQGYKIQPF